MIAISYGGGTNSTALVIEAIKRGYRPDLIVFADTGAEMPHTYQFIEEEFNPWLVARGFTLHRVRWVRTKGERAGKFIALDEECLLDGDLPSRVYGLSGCTSKYKQQVIDGFVAKHSLTKQTWALGKSVERWLWYDADETRRGDGKIEGKQGGLFLPTSLVKYRWRAPLREWGLGREDCEEIIRKTNLSQPGKSSCYMCPSMKEEEKGSLPPELLDKALAIEDKARPGLTSIKGLGTSFSWRDLVEGKPIQRGVRPKPSCGCHDQGDLF